MTDRTTSPPATTDYHALSKLFHWLIAALIVLQYVLHEFAEHAEENGQTLRELALIANHKSVGITVLLLALARLVWRFIAPPPALPASMPRWQVTASHVSHFLLYGLMLLMPISGWLMSSAYGFSVSWFNVVQLPDLVAKNAELSETLYAVHEILGKMLFVIALIHILAALKHGFVDRDGVLGRISSVATVALGAVVAGVGGWYLTMQGTPSAVAQTVSADAGAVPADSTTAPAGDSALPVWDIDEATSFIRFTGDQAGASFDGEWQEWTARLQFDEAALDASRFDVTIETAAVETGDTDRDTTLKDPDWFDVGDHPQAFYRASAFRRQDDGRFAADGQLIIKGKPSPVTFVFSVESDGSRRILTGEAALLRLELGVGTGEWEDTTWVSNEVTVDVRIEATVAAE